MSEVEVDSNCVLMMDPDADESVLDFVNEDEVSGIYTTNDFAYILELFRNLYLKCLCKKNMLILVPFSCKVSFSKHYHYVASQ